MKFKALAPFTPRLTKLACDIYKAISSIGGTTPTPPTPQQSGGLPTVITSFPYTQTFTETPTFCTIGIYKSNLMKSVIALLNRYPGRTFNLSLRADLWNCTTPDGGSISYSPSTAAIFSRSGTSPLIIGISGGTANLLVPVTPSFGYTTDSNGDPCIFHWYFDRDGAWIFANNDSPVKSTYRAYKLTVTLTIN